jgi:Type IIB DNA topoisomerase
MPPKRKQPNTKRRKDDLDYDDDGEEQEEVAAQKAPPPTKKGKRKVVPLAKDADQVLQKCRALKAKLRAKTSTCTTSSITPKANSKQDKTSSSEEEDAYDDGDESFEDDVKAMLSKMDPATTPDTIPSKIIEVSELKAKEVLEGMETLALRIANQVLTKQGFSMVVPSRAASNQIYIAEWDRIVLGNKCSSRNFLHVKDSRKTAITLRVMHLLHAVLTKRIHITKRDLFYTDVKLFVNQMDSDGVLDDVATMIGCTRSNLNVVASDKGLVVGRIQFEEDGDYIDCTKMG